ncbi:unnamed protein product [Paramecium sonneborni]|uniref:Transmembrane protein n=1 Tax=Paramecium sonneborni TaxID=65129 RepID=A0A8S1RMJ3_9CILI|nr:unnamed protein product [Paramecium sonneborni]
MQGLLQLMIAVMILLVQQDVINDYLDVLIEAIVILVVNLDHALNTQMQIYQIQPLKHNTVIGYEIVQYNKFCSNFFQSSPSFYQFVQLGMFCKINSHLKIVKIKLYKLAINQLRQ